MIATGADLALFCAVTKFLDRKYPGRAAEADGVNAIVQLLIQLENTYAALPEVPPRETSEAST